MRDFIKYLPQSNIDYFCGIKLEDYDKDELICIIRHTNSCDFKTKINKDKYFKIKNKNEYLIVKFLEEDSNKSNFKGIIVDSNSTWSFKIGDIRDFNTHSFERYDEFDENVKINQYVYHNKTNQKVQILDIKKWNEVFDTTTLTSKEDLYKINNLWHMRSSFRLLEK